MITIGRLVGKEWASVDTEFHVVTIEDDPVIRDRGTKVPIE